MQQNNLLGSSLANHREGETLKVIGEGTETVNGKQKDENQTGTKLLEEVLSRENLLEALKRVIENKGSAGVDGMTVKELKGYLKLHWETIKQELLENTYKPKPVRRVEIPKPGGGVRSLGIPTVLDRLIQQALLQVLQKQWDPSFSRWSYGFRPKRSAKEAVTAAQKFIKQGRTWVVDIDLEKFFDRVNHDKLMGLVEQRISDRRVTTLIRKYLRSGIMEQGLFYQTEEGTPQGGPLSPLLSNLMLDLLDKELERRQLRFVRYADDCNIYVKSERAGKRVMESVTRFLEVKLKLKVNTTKSAVAKPSERKFLGFTFTKHEFPRRKVAPKSVKRFKQKVKSLTGRSGGKNLRQVIANLTPYLKGWANYFSHAEQSKTEFQYLDKWIRRRLRSLVWKQWGTRRYRELRARGIPRILSWRTHKSSHGPWRIAKSPALHLALSDKLFDKLGLPKLTSCYC